ncbi:TRAP transporter large permease [uncultured Roseibium sp.]|uniref:TRAP transporter large permease n=1 Tax=uncultured Roseibium sp. TaxID=1936171 RepID=UPI0032164FA5
MSLVIGIGGLLLLLVAGMPIGFALATSGALGLAAHMGPGIVGPLMADSFFEHSSSYLLLTVPMFVLMSEYLSASGIARDIVVASYRWIGRLPGGLGIACVAASALMAAVIGSSTASAATMSTAAFPNMKQLNYHPRLAAGIIAISGTLAIMIPPSVILVIYGIMTEQSIGKLLIAGVIPGLLTMLGYIVVMVYLALRHPHLAPRAPSFDLRTATKSLTTVWPVMLLIVVVIGSLYGGVATPTEIGAVGSLFALVIVVILRRINGEGMRGAMENTLRTYMMIMMIILGAMVFGFFMTYTQLPQKLVTAATESQLPPWVILAMLLGIYLFLGCFLDQIAILVLTVPLTFPIVSSLGFDGIWYGIIITKTVEIGLVTPPLGLNVYVTSSVTGVPLGEAFKGVLPFLLMEFFLLFLLVAVPDLSLWLPSHMR